MPENISLLLQGSSSPKQAGLLPTLPVLGCGRQGGLWGWLSKVRRGQVSLGWISGSKVVFAPSLLERHREEKPAQEEESVVEFPPEFCRILIPAGSRGENTLLPLLHPNPSLVSGHWQHKKGGHQGLGPHSRHVFAASSSLTRCYLTKDGSSCRGEEERDKLVLTGEIPAWQSHSPAGMCVKSPLKPSTSQCPLQSRHPREGWIHTLHFQALPKPHQRGLRSLKVPVGLAEMTEGRKSGQGSSRDAVSSTQTGGWPCWERAEHPGDTRISGLQWREIREGQRDSHLWEGEKGQCRGVGAFVCLTTLGDTGCAPITLAIKAGQPQHPSAGTSSAVWEVSSTFWGPSLCRGGFPGK